MVSPTLTPELRALIDFQFPGSDLVAVIPYVIPLIFIGAILLLYQRFMEHEDTKRNLTIFFGGLSLLTAIILVIFAGYGSYWWWNQDQTLGSWDVFVGGLQWMTDAIFGSVLIGTLYVALIGILFTVLARMVIAPPNPDFLKLNEEMKEAREAAEQARAKTLELEGENKKLNEFISERESALTTLQEELTGLTTRAEEREVELAQMRTAMESASPTAEQEAHFLSTLSEKDQTIGTLQEELAALRAAASTAPAATPEDAEQLSVMEGQLKGLQAKLEELARRSDTATEVSDSVISDLAELMAQVESSGLEPPAKKALVGLLESLGRAIGRVSGAPGERPSDEPRIEMIGAVMMVHEIVDVIKRLTRGS